MFSDDPFAYFGLDQETADEAALKRAYAQKLKTTRPDEDPQGFMKLREAYNAARTWLSDAAEGKPAWQAGGGPLAAAIGAGEPAESIAESTSGPAAEEVAREAPWSGTASPQVVLEEIVQLLESDDAGSKQAELLGLLNDPAVEDLDSFIWLSRAVRDYICERTGMFDDESETGPRWHLWTAGALLFDLERHFGWAHQQASEYWEVAQNNWVTRLSAKLRDRLDRGATGELSRQRRRRRRSGGYRYSRAPDSAPDTRPVTRQTVSDEGGGGGGWGVAWSILRILLFFGVIANVIRGLNTH